MRSTTKFAMMASFAMYSSQNQESLAVVDSFSPLVPMKDYVPPNDFDNDPSLHYPDYYRILNCWECFEAQGKVCTDAGHNSMYHHTKSSDPGNTFCCKPDANNGYCQHGHTHDYDGIEYGLTTVCSEPSFGATNEFQNILTGNRNHQMYAFCPYISHQKCGIISDHTHDASDMNLKAGLEKVHVQSNEMRYHKATPQDPTREYDSCYYEVTLDTSVLDNYIPKKIHVQFSAKHEMNVYIYGGKSRYEATESIISGNEQVTVGTTYTITPDKGFLIVAYPNKDQETEFGFNYWLEADVKPAPGEEIEESQGEEEQTNETTETEQTNETTETETETEPITGYEVVEVETVDPGRETKYYSQPSNPTPQPQEDETLFYILCGGAGFLLISIILICIKCRNKGKIQTANDLNDMDMNYPQHTGEAERSMQLEDMDDENNQSNRPSLGKGNMFENDSEKMKRSSYKEVNAASVMSGREEDNGTQGDER